MEIYLKRTTLFVVLFAIIVKAHIKTHNKNDLQMEDMNSEKEMELKTNVIVTDKINENIESPKEYETDEHAVVPEEVDNLPNAYSPDKTLKPETHPAPKITEKPFVIIKPVISDEKPLFSPGRGKLPIPVIPPPTLETLPENLQPLTPVPS